VTQIYKIGSEIWGLSPKKFGDPKISSFRRDFTELCDVIANISVLEQNVVNRKTTLQTATTPEQTDTFSACPAPDGINPIGPKRILAM